jgi:multicomponent Na+:H+ antiporter subunit F
MELVYIICFGVLGACCFLCLLRILLGPTAPDRTVAIDILGIIIVGFCAFMAVLTKQDFFINIAIAWGLLSFIGTIALAKYLQGRGFDE